MVRNVCRVLTKEAILPSVSSLLTGETVFGLPERGSPQQSAGLKSSLYGRDAQVTKRPPGLWRGWVQYRATMVPRAAGEGPD